MRIRQVEVEEEAKRFEQLVITWDSIDSAAKQVKIWTLEHAPCSVELLKSSTLSAEEKAKTSEELQQQLTFQMSAIKKLHQDLDSLNGKL